MKPCVRHLLNYYVPPKRFTTESREFGWDVVVTYYPIGLPTPPAMIRLSESLVIEENKTAEDIVRSVARHEPYDQRGRCVAKDLGVCRGVAEESMSTHDDDCPYRQAVEWVAEDDTKPPSGQHG